MDDYTRTDENTAQSCELIETPSSASLWQPLLLIEGEDPQAYDTLAANLNAVLEPKDAIEQLFAQDIAYQQWEIQRGRQFKAVLYGYKAAASKRALLEPLLGSEAAADLVERAEAHEQDALAEVSSHLTTLKATPDVVAAVSLSQNFDLFEGLDRITTNAEVRRNMALQEFHRHRANAPTKPHAGKEDIVSAEYEEAGE